MEASMQINGAAVRALREKKSWSQEHLASASGLSVRTIQRVEVENLASAETRLALAAALDVPVVVLVPPQASSAVAGMQNAPNAPGRLGSLLRNVALAVAIAAALVVGFVVVFNALSNFLPRQGL